MKALNTLIAASALFAAPAFAAPFTAPEMITAAKAATTAFKDEFGAALFNTIYGIQSTQGADGGKVKLFYKEGSANKSLEFFCHYHEPTEIDCHEI